MAEFPSKSENIEDIMASVLSASGDISITHDDGNDQITVDVSTLSDEEVEDIVANLISGGNAATVSYDDPGDTLTVVVDEGSISHGNLSGIASDSHHSKTSSASELSDVSPDSDSSAHHSKYSPTLVASGAVNPNGGGYYYLRGDMSDTLEFYESESSNTYSFYTTENVVTVGHIGRFDNINGRQIDYEVRRF